MDGEKKKRKKKDEKEKKKEKKRREGGPHSANGVPGVVIGRRGGQAALLLAGRMFTASSRGQSERGHSLEPESALPDLDPYRVSDSPEELHDSTVTDCPESRVTAASWIDPGSDSRHVDRTPTLPATLTVTQRGTAGPADMIRSECSGVCMDRTYFVPLLHILRTECTAEYRHWHPIHCFVEYGKRSIASRKPSEHHCPKASLPLDQIHHATALCRLQPLRSSDSDHYGDYVAPQRQLKRTSG